MRIKAHKPPPSMGTAMTSLFVELFERDRVLQRAYQLGAIQRLREQHPLDVLPVMRQLPWYMGGSPG